MKFFTSRYTASLEQQVAELKAELLERKQTILGLYADMAELRLQLACRPTPKTPEQAAKDATPKVSNWLRTRSQLETPDQIVKELEPEQEN